MTKIYLTSVLAASFALAATPKPKIEAAPSTPPATHEGVFAGTRVVHVGDRDVIALNARIRYTTMIVLPKEETILDFVCGDKEFWVVNGSQNFAFIKPAKPESATNLNLITASGNVYSFTLTEGGEPDLKVIVEPKGEGLLGSLKAAPRFVPVQSIDDYREQVQIAKAEAATAREEASKQIEEASKRTALDVAKARTSFPATMRFDYDYKGTPEFAVSAIYHDDKFTYIAATPQETPALYELKDGKPSQIQYSFSDGLYTAPKILDRFYLQIGKKNLHVTRVAK